MTPCGLWQRGLGRYLGVDALAGVLGSECGISRDGVDACGGIHAACLGQPLIQWVTTGLAVWLSGGFRRVSTMDSTVNF